MKSINSFISIAALIVSMVISSSLFAQDDINKVLAQLDTKSFQPLTDAFSSDINSGLYHSAKVNKSFSLYLGVKASTTGIVEGPSNLKISSMPFAVPQLTLGSVLGTDVTLRFMPNITIGKYGSVNTFGFAVRHSISQYVKKAPIDAAVQFAYQKFSVSDTKDNNAVNSGSIAANLQFSKELSIFTFYAGVQYEQTTANYTFSYDGLSQNINIQNQNNLRGTLGLNIKLGPVNLNGDCSLSKSSSFSAGFGFAF